VNRRDLIALLRGAVASWPVGVRAQQPERMRRIGVLVGSSKDDPEMQARLAGFRQGLESRGWSQARIHINITHGTDCPLPNLLTHLALDSKRSDSDLYTR
jgi:hypothetical protein